MALGCRHAFGVDWTDTTSLSLSESFWIFVAQSVNGDVFVPTVVSSSSPTSKGRYSLFASLLVEERPLFWPDTTRFPHLDVAF
jgi:hypothetical protein